MQKFSLHTHTLGFDGRNTEEEMLIKAKDLGWNFIGFSNHFIVYPTIRNSPMYEHALKGGYANIYSSSFDEAISKFEPHYRKIDNIQKNVDIRIFKGMEVDFFPNQEWLEDFQKAVAYLKPDYLIGAVHFIENDNVLYNSHDLKKMSPIIQNRFLYRYWQNEIAAIKSGLFTFMAHLDLMKKVGLGNEDNWAEEERKTVIAARETGVMVELNSSYYKIGEEPYPKERIIKMLAQENVPVLVSDDAHSSMQLGNKFEETLVFAKRCGVTNFYKVNNEQCALNKFLKFRKFKLSRS